MSLDQESIDSLVASMALTKKGLKASLKDGGYFYFAGDSKGTEGALIVFSESKDADGGRTKRSGRKLLKVFRSAGVTPRYSQGQISSGKPMVFSIEKGNLKPALMKQVFKKCTTLHRGVGQDMVSVLKSARFQMASQDTAEDLPKRTASEQAAHQEQVENWRKQNTALLAELGEMSSEEVEDLFAAEVALRILNSDDAALDEQTALEEEQANLEDDLIVLAADAERLTRTAGTNLDAALDMESVLNQRRAELSSKLANSHYPFGGEQLAPEDQELNAAVVHASAQLLMDQMLNIHDLDTEARSEMEAMSDEALGDALPDFEAGHAARVAELETISQQLAQLIT